MASDQPNVVFVLTDDQGYGDLSCHGNPVVRTPHLDELHNCSIRLTDYHVGPTCAPTRAGLLTGHYANSTGVWHTIGGRSLLRSDEVSMADYFRRSGYATGIFGKWHLGDNAPYRPQDRGFETVVVHGGGGIGQTPDYWGNNYFDDSYWNGEQHTRYEGYCTDVWFQEALKFIERNKTEKFFCYIPTNAPHSPHLVDPAFSDPYLTLTPHAERAKFYGMVANIDENVGGLRRRLAELGLAENTIFIFMTDNGSAGGVEVDDSQFVTSGFNAGMRGQKGSEYDGGHRVPLFLHWPAGGLSTGRDLDEVTANVDVLPTLIELCGLDNSDSDSFDGRSLAPLLQPGEGDPAVWPERALVTDSQRLTYPVKWRKSAVMTGGWRLVNGRELYAIKEDPEQRQDVAATHADVVSELRQAYELWWDKVSRQFDEDIPIAIGGPGARHTRLNTHDWRNEDCDSAWNQSLVRQGHICNGHWEVEVVEAGNYSFTLRRWPEEEGAGVREGLPGGEPKAFRDIAIQPVQEGHTGEARGGQLSLKERIPWGGGVALPVFRARIAIAGQEASAEVAHEDVGARFELSLTAGCTHLQTWFETEDGDELGAYYVYVEWLGP
ncbi:MAG: arylsulfatase [Caldilineaceae bacterium]|nr:arylsulfatase [Caldilineaceae bacterium]MDE0339780.1 arylsulfatase [Caldilineaceae bacterium]